MARQLTLRRLRRDLAELFDLTARGTLVVRVGGRYPMQEVAAAHAAMEPRKTTGKVTLQMR
jgi:NADPH2:quinone reductase